MKERRVAPICGRTGCDDFDPTRPPPVDLQALIFGSIVTSTTLAMGWHVGYSWSTDLTTGQGGG